MGKGYPRQLRDIPQHDKLLKENHEILKKLLVCMNVGLVYDRLRYSTIQPGLHFTECGKRLSHDRLVNEGEKNDHVHSS